MKRTAAIVIVLWTLLVVPLGVSIVSGLLNEWLKTSQQYLPVLSAAAFWAALLAGLSVWAVLHARRQELREEFDLFTASEQLKPDAFGFKRVKPGEPPPEGRRPYFEAYISRQAVLT